MPGRSGVPRRPSALGDASLPIGVRLDTFAGTLPGRVTLAGLLAVVASNPGQAGLGVPILLALVGAAWLSSRVGLAVLFAVTFLPAIKGLPFSPTFLTVGALIPWIALHRTELLRVPRGPLVAATLILALATLTYPASRSISLLVLAVALVGFILTLLMARGRSTGDCLRDFVTGATGTFLIPFLMNGFLATSSPFLGEINAMWLLGGRVTFGVYEANMASAYLAAALAGWTWGGGRAALKGFRQRHTQRQTTVLYAVIGLGLFILLAVSGSRASLVVGVAAVVVAAALGYGPGARRLGPSTRQGAVAILATMTGLIALALALNPNLLSGVSRIATSEAGDETMRVNNLAAGLRYLDQWPLLGMDPLEYLWRVFPMHPHNAFLAGVVFVGLLVFIPTVVLLWTPLVDALAGAPWSPSLALTAALVTLTLVQQTIPFPFDQGVFLLTALWYAGAARPHPDAAPGAGTVEPL